MCDRELETEQNCNILTPTLLAITTFLSRSPGLLNRGPGAQPLWVLVFYRILSLTGLVSKLSIGCLKAPSAGCWLSLPHLVSNWSGHQTDWISCALHYIIVQHPPFSGGRHNRTHSSRPQSRLYTDIPWADAPVIYTGAFPILTARLGRRAIYNICIFAIDEQGPAYTTRKKKYLALWRRPIFSLQQWLCRCQKNMFPSKSMFHQPNLCG